MPIVFCISPHPITFAYCVQDAPKMQPSLSEAIGSPNCRHNSSKGSVLLKQMATTSYGRTCLLHLIINSSLNKIIFKQMHMYVGQ